MKQQSLSDALAATPVLVSYDVMVRNLFKPLDTMAATVQHAVVGIAGEVGELLDAYKKTWIYNKPLDEANVLEEYGDIAFYAEALSQALDLPYRDNWISIWHNMHHSQYMANPTNHAAGMVMYAELPDTAAVQVADCCDLYVSASRLLTFNALPFRNKLDGIETYSAMAGEVARAVATFHMLLARSVYRSGLVPLDILRTNQQKLGKRYPAGVYADAAAQARADKAPQ